MKKIIILFSIILILSGCNNSLTINFNDKINTKIELHIPIKDDNTQDKIQAILSEARPLKNSYDEMFKETKLSTSNVIYEAEYEYDYTYSNFKDNKVLSSCFEYSSIQDLDDKLYINLSGNSNCSTFKLTIKADKRMLENNAQEKTNDEYIWNINEENNDVEFYISKDKTNNSLSTWNIISIILAIILGLLLFIFKNKIKK